MSMFCYQCEQTAQGTGCTKMGVCGKDETTANLQDQLFEKVKEISFYANRARKKDKKDNTVDRFVIEALFVTVTNVNFDPSRIKEYIAQADDIIVKAKGLADTDETFQPDPMQAPFIEYRKQKLGEDVTGLQELIAYGLKGSAAYMDHAAILGFEDDQIYADFHKFIDFLNSDDAEKLDNLVDTVLQCGELNLRVMELLDKANTETYGHPEPTEARVTPVKGKCILVSGHDLKDLYELLEQTEGKGINVYTHGEMLPCLAYPGLKKFSHLAGNYGGAWQDQRKEFEAFPGPILMTTNCIQKPKDSYVDRIFTKGLVGWPGVKHIQGNDYSQLIQAALEADGFVADSPEKKITIGFGRNTVMSVADKVIEAVKGGNIKHFFLIGGCDGAKPGRNYYTELAEQVPEDCVILTLACGKYRFNKMDFGDIGGIPRLLDIGQCNDAYSAIQIAVALSQAFECEVNDLPLTLVLSWYEQKAVCILLTLLYLGIKDMRIGPSLPAFVTPAVLDVLVKNFNLKPISTPQEDLKEILA